MGLSGLAGRFEEEHSLHRHHVGANELLQHIEHAAVQHIALVQLHVFVKLYKTKILIVLLKVLFNI